MAAGYSNDELNEFNYSVTLLGREKNEAVDEITKVANMGWFKRLGDSKVPNKDRWLFHWFSLQVSDPKLLARELYKFKALFEDIEVKIEQLKNGEGDADEILNELYKKLMEYHMYAESEIDKDSSTTICKYHKDFVAKEDRLDNIVRRVECAQNRREIRTLKKELAELTGKLDKAMEQNVDLANHLTKAVKQQKEMMDQQKNLIDENTLLEASMKQFISDQKKDQERYYGSMVEKFDKLVTMNEDLIKENREMKKMLEKKDEKK